MRIAIINYHPAFNVGGSEIQCDLIARELVKQGHHPLYLALGLPQSLQPHEVFAEIPYPVLRYDGPTGLTRLLRSHFVDVVYWRCGRAMLLRTAWAARRAGAKVVYAISGWSNVKPTWNRDVARTPGLRSGVARVVQPLKGKVKSRINWEGFRYVDGIVSNTQYILDSMPRGPSLPRPRSTIYNIAPDPQRLEPFDWRRPYVAWVANLQRVKNPDTVVELAQAVPHVDVLMAGKIKESAFDYFQEPSRLPPNLYFLGPINPSRASGLMAGARCLVHTCSPEGFSGNLIQAWSQGCPTLVLHHDPDGVIGRSGAGRHCGTIDLLVESVRQVYSDDALRTAWSTAARNLVREEFDAAKNVGRLIEFCDQLRD